MLSLNDVEWEQFKVKDIFDIENCKCSNASMLSKGNVPYIGATNRNNGVLNFVEESSLITAGNCVVFICDGAGSVGYSIYKQEDFIGSTTLKIGRNKKLNKYNGLFITTIADKIRGKYNFGFKRNEKHLGNEILLLPVTSKNQPDWDFMEYYIKKKEEVLLKKYKDYLGKNLNNNSNDYMAEVINLSSKKWGEFKISDIFSMVRGKRLVKSDRLNGNVPFVTAGHKNQGVSVFIGNEDMEKFSNVITIDMFGEAFYRSYTFCCDDNIHVLTGKGSVDGLVNQFIVRLINNNNKMFSYGKQYRTKIFNRQKIMLPIDDKGDPDYTFMENYMKRIVHEKITKYLDYIEKRIN